MVSIAYHEQNKAENIWLSFSHFIPLYPLQNIELQGNLQKQQWAQGGDLQKKDEISRNYIFSPLLSEVSFPDQKLAVCYKPFAFRKISVLLKLICKIKKRKRRKKELLLLNEYLIKNCQCFY